MPDSPGQRLGEILTELAGIGPVLPGSISERWTRCQRAGCHCRDDPPRLHGPYPTWTWRPTGVGVTKTLTTAQAETLRSYSLAHQRLRQLVNELEQVSLALIEESSGIELARPESVGRRRAKPGKSVPDG
jgi:hypothetical protein